MTCSKHEHADEAAWPIEGEVGDPMTEEEADAATEAIHAFNLSPATDKVMGETARQLDLAERHRAQQMLAVWKLRARWWVTPAAFALGLEARGPSDRTYNHVLVPEQQVFEVRYDAMANVWGLDKDASYLCMGHGVPTSSSLLGADQYAFSPEHENVPNALGRGCPRSAWQSRALPLRKPSRANCRVDSVMWKCAARQYYFAGKLALQT